MSQTQGAAKAGTLDPTFNGDGIRKFPIPEISALQTYAVLALPEGKLLVGMLMQGRGAGFAVARLNMAGELDAGTGFGDKQHGFVVISFPNTHIDHLFGLSRLNDGGSLVVGQYGSLEGLSSGLVIVRLREDGQLNSGFGTGGAIFLEHFDIGNPEQKIKLTPGVVFREGEKNPEQRPLTTGNSGMSVIEQPDGKIVLVSTGFEDLAKMRGVVMRLNSDGSFDKGFNGSGAAFVHLEEDYEIESYGLGVAIQPDGKLMVHGHFNKSDGSSGPFVVRFDQQGSPDKGFNPPTFVESPGRERIYINAVATRKQDGLIVAVGQARRFSGITGGLGLIVVLNRDGSPNLVFNNGEPLYSLLLDSGELWQQCAFGGPEDSKLIVAGTGGDGFVTKYAVSITARFLLTGVPDPTFNGQGWAVFDESEEMETVRDMTIMTDGRIVVSGVAWKGEGLGTHISGGWVLRYLV